MPQMAQVLGQARTLGGRAALSWEAVLGGTSHGAHSRQRRESLWAVDPPGQLPSLRSSFSIGQR